MKLTRKGISGVGSGIDNRIARWDGTSGLQSSGITLSDLDEISGVKSITIPGTTSGDFISFGSGTAQIYSSTANRLQLEGGTAVYLTAGAVDVLQASSTMIQTGSNVDFGLNGTGSFYWDTTDYRYYRSGTTLRSDSIGGFIQLVGGVWTTRLTSTYFAPQAAGVDLGVDGPTTAWDNGYINSLFVTDDATIDNRNPMTYSLMMRAG